MTKMRIIGLVAIILVGTGMFFCFKHEKERAEKRFAGELFAFGLAYHHFFDEHKVGPSGLDDMEEKDQFPAVCDLIRKGELQVVWKARFYGGAEEMGKFLLAYEKDGESKTSWGLTASGSPVRIAPENYELWPKIGSIKERNRD